MTREAVSTVLEFVGFVLVVAAAFVIHLALGLVVVGSGLVAVGYLVGRPELEARP